MVRPFRNSQIIIQTVVNLEIISILTYNQLNKNMRNSDLFSFLTPPPKNSSFTNRNNSLLASNYNKTHGTSYGRKSTSRRPIFEQQKTLLRNTINFNANRTSFAQQKISKEHILTYDFCGCQNQVTPCQIIEKTFLKKVSLKEMKQQYGQLYEKQDLAVSMNAINQSRKKKLYKILPSIYPQLYYTHLNNLLNIIGEDLNQAEFSCLSWIQYHSKVQYITYFLYQDLKASFKNKARFVDNMNQQSLKKGNNLYSIRAAVVSKGYGQAFDKFLSAYYDSIGANLLPVTQYARFIKLIFKKKGGQVLYKFFLNFIQKKTAQLEAGFRFLNHGQIAYYRNYMRELNWDELFDLLQQ